MRARWQAIAKSSADAKKALPSNNGSDILTTMNKFTKDNLHRDGYKIEQVINRNPYLFYGMFSYPEDHPKRRYMKPIYAVEWLDKKQGYCYETYYYTSLMAAKKSVLRNVRRK